MFGLHVLTLFATILLNHIIIGWVRYMDRPLNGARAVQVLSRLNRRHPAKRRTIVIDFVNQAETIREAFEDYWGCTVWKPGWERRFASSAAEACVNRLLEALPADALALDSASGSGSHPSQSPGTVEAIAVALDRLSGDAYGSTAVSRDSVVRDLEKYVGLCDEHSFQRYEMPAPFARALLRSLKDRDVSSAVIPGAAASSEIATSVRSDPAAAAVIARLGVKVQGVAKTHSGAIRLRCSAHRPGLVSAVQAEAVSSSEGFLRTVTQPEDDETELPLDLSCLPTSECTGLTLASAVERHGRERPNGGKKKKRASCQLHQLVFGVVMCWDVLNLDLIFITAALCLLAHAAILSVVRRLYGDLVAATAFSPPDSLTLRNSLRRLAVVDIEPEVTTRCTLLEGIDSGEAATSSQLHSLLCGFICRC